MAVTSGAVVGFGLARTRVSFPLHTTVEDRIASHPEIRQNPRSEVSAEEPHPLPVAGNALHGGALLG
jgi:hypothetical protein